MIYKLFLDDIRGVRDVFPHARLYEWIVVKNYNEFVEVIQKKGLPFFVSFDHDLSLEHDPCFEPDGGINSQKKIPYDEYKERTGYHAAKWLVEYCMDNNLTLPKWNVHSANPVGAGNIESYLTSYENSVK
jgi:hypothetical protein